MRLVERTSVKSTRCGEVISSFVNANLRLKEARLVLNLGYSLVSTGRWAGNNIEWQFSISKGWVIFNQHVFIGRGKRDPETGTGILPETITHQTENHSVAGRTHSETLLWHWRLAHINAMDVLQIHKHADGVPALEQMADICRAYRLRKGHKLPLPSHFQLAAAVRDIMHSDIVGPSEPSFPDDHRYVSTFL